MVRGSEHPHTGDVGNTVSVLEGLRSGREDRTGPCERVRHTNIMKINNAHPRNSQKPSTDTTLNSRSDSKSEKNTKLNVKY